MVYIMGFQAIFIIGMGGADAGSAPQHNKVCQRVSHTATAVQFTIEACTDVSVQSIIGL